MHLGWLGYWRAADAERGRPHASTAPGKDRPDGESSRLICTGPDSEVRSFDAPAGWFTVYGPDERTKVLTEVGMFVAGLAAQLVWAGDGLLTPLCQSG